jgi:trehalose 6-phosphate synthase
MNEADRLASAGGLMAESGISLVTLAPDEATYKMAYDVIANATLWFAHHQLFDQSRRPRFDARWHEAWSAYEAFNEMFAAAVVEHAAKDAVVLVQDYHLSLLGGLLATRRPDLRTVHFSHTPFAPAEAMRLLPWRASGALLSGMAGFGACGFHARRWEAGFNSCYADEFLAAQAGRRGPRTFVSPIGPDPEILLAEAAAAEADAANRALEESVGGRKLIVRVDRIELTKNLLRGFWAYEELLAAYPEWHDRVVLLALAYPSREGLADYLAYRSEVEHCVTRINERFAKGDWTPILFDTADDRTRSLAALRAYDTLLVNPIRDGMNLVAKEGPLLNERSGVLVLSTEAGAYAELEPAVLGINPFDVSATAAALLRALEMPDAQRIEMAGRLRALAGSHTAADWLADQLSVAATL